MTDSASTGPKQVSPKVLPNLFKPGQSGNPKGRPKGSRDKLGYEFVAALQVDFAKHGAETIVKVREERPQDYLRVIASILPKEVTVTTNAVTEMSDDELANALAALEHLAGKHGAATVSAAGRGDTTTQH